MQETEQETPITQADRQRTYHQKQRERGLVRLSVYIPDSERDTFWDAVDRLRITWQRKGLID